MKLFFVLSTAQREFHNYRDLSQKGSFSGSFQIFEVNGPDIKAMNDFGKENIKTQIKPELKVKGYRSRTPSLPIHLHY
jgi:alpha-N-arabinofuranosidase